MQCCRPLSCQAAPRRWTERNAKNHGCLAKSAEYVTLRLQERVPDKSVKVIVSISAGERLNRARCDEYDVMLPAQARDRAGETSQMVPTSLG